MRHYSLYTLCSPDSPELLQQVGQLQQIVVTKQTPTCGQDHEWIYRQHRRPTRWNRAQEAAFVVEVDSILSPVVAVGDQLETLAIQRMMRVNHFKSTVGTVAMRCS